MAKNNCPSKIVLEIFFKQIELFRIRTISNKKCKFAYRPGLYLENFDVPRKNIGEYRGFQGNIHLHENRSKDQEIIPCLEFPFGRQVDLLNFGVFFGEIRKTVLKVSPLGKPIER